MVTGYIVGVLLVLLVTAAYGIKFVPARNKALSYSTAYHIEEDVSNSEQLIVSTYTALHSLQGEELEIIVGSDDAPPGYKEGVGEDARFNFISSFHQVNTTHIIVVDHCNNCLRLVNRETASTSRFAGVCSKIGELKNGNSTEAMFNKPRNLISGYYQNEYYLTDAANNAIRLIRVSSDHQLVSVSTLIRGYELINPSGLSLDRRNHRLLVATQHSLVIIDIFTNNITSSFSLGKPQFLDRDVISLTPDVFLITNGTEIGLLNITAHNNWTTVDILTSSRSCNDDKPDRPYCLHLTRNRTKLFIGRKCSVQFVNVSEPVPVDPPPVTTARPTQNTMTTGSESAATQRPATQVSETTPNASTKIFKSSITQTSTAHASDSSSLRSVGLQGFFSFSDWKGVTVLSLTVVIVAMVIAFISRTVIRKRRKSVRRMKSQSSTSSSDNQDQVYEQPITITMLTLSSPEEERPWPQNRDLPTPPPTGDTSGASLYELPYNEPVELINEPPVSIAPLPPTNGNRHRRQPSEICQTEHHYQEVHPRYANVNATDQSHSLLMSEAKNDFSTLQSQRSNNTSLSLNFGNS